MKLDLSQTGLYYLLNTPEVQAELGRLGLTDKASFEKKPDVGTIARLIANSISGDVEQFIKEKLEAAEKQEKKPEKWIFETLRDLPITIQLKDDLARALPSENPPSRHIITEIKASEGAEELQRPNISLIESDLLVPNGHSPQLGTEIAKELKSCDHADWLVSFIKLRAIKSFYPQLRAFCEKANPDGSPRLRIATTTYIGATDAAALDLLWQLPNTEVKVCFNTSQTRLHAKAYIFKRASQFGSAYIGSANLSNAALTSGLEWTVKVAQQEIPHLWDRSLIEFEQCWNDESFELLTGTDEERKRVVEALKRSKVVYNMAGASKGDAPHRVLMNFHPHSYQSKMLSELAEERRQGQWRHLIASATGTGKTVVAAFDYAQEMKSRQQAPKILFLAHRTDIVKQARATYQAVLGNDEFGVIIGEDDYDSNTIRQCFCTVQSWRNHVQKDLPRDYFDLIVMDECHHAGAASYQEIIEYYKPEIDAGKTDLLGLTATPFRSDGVDIRSYFGGDFTHELSLAEAIDQGNIVPFTYFGIDDDTDYSGVDWAKSESAEIEKAIRSNGKHLANVYEAINQYVADLGNLRAIGFCAGLEHAHSACKYMNDHGIKAVVLQGESTEEERRKAKADIEAIPPRVNIIFTADLFNEGVDIPSVNTALMMRPTNSALVFVQQLGRGLRLAPPQYDKQDLLVLDFVGNHNAKYKGFMRYKFMSVRKDIPLEKQIDEGMPYLPAGCSITLSKKSREKILANIREYFAKLRGKALLNHLVEIVTEAGRHLPIEELMDRVSATSPAPIYREAAPYVIEKKALTNVEVEDLRHKKLNDLMQNDSPNLLNDWKKLLHGDVDGFGAQQLKLAKFFLLTRFYHDVRIDSVDTFWKIVTAEKGFTRDLLEFIEWRKKQINPMHRIVFPETSDFLELHRTYSTSQISAALGRGGGVIMTGTDYNRERNVDSFFVTRIKDERDFSPTTMYKDYAKTLKVFHWQSPSRTTVLSSEGQRYINDASKKMLFIRQSKQHKLDITGNYSIAPTTSNYIFLGPVSKVLSHEGECPISFDFELQYPMPADVYDFARGA